LENVIGNVSSSPGSRGRDLTGIPVHGESSSNKNPFIATILVAEQPNPRVNDQMSLNPSAQVRDSLLNHP